MSYKPIRDRGVYRAAANPKNINHAWALTLVNGLCSENPMKVLSGHLAWYYRDKGDESIMKALVFSDNPLLTMQWKNPTPGAYLPVPLKYK